MGRGAVMTAAASGKRAVLWFRNDLRLHDNAIIAEAAKKVQSGDVTEVRCTPSSMLPVSSIVHGSRSATRTVAAAIAHDRQCHSRCS